MFVEVLSIRSYHCKPDLPSMDGEVCNILSFMSFVILVLFRSVLFCSARLPVLLIQKTEVPDLPLARNWAVEKRMPASPKLLWLE